MYNLIFLIIGLIVGFIAGAIAMYEFVKYINENP